MKIVNLLNKKFNYEFEKTARLFFPFDRITVTNSKEEADVVISEEKEEEKPILKMTLSLLGSSIEDKVIVDKTESPNEIERNAAVMLYKALSALTGFSPPWGILTGVRPARLYLSKVREMGKENAQEYFRNKLLVSDEKINLSDEVASREESIIASTNLTEYSLYVSIPFCPSRCSYCSFVSHSVESAKKLIPQYIGFLIKELLIISKTADEAGLKLKTVYIGGGTPTTLSPAELDLLLTTIEENFDLDNLLEFTVEAGRPDTIDIEKLKVIKKHRVNRISINPQTLSDKVLKNIGRRHTAKQFTDAFLLAREVGFDNINCDLIAGLPGDDIESFSITLSKICRLSPESVTVHALSQKRASDINIKGEKIDNYDKTFCEQAVKLARNYLAKYSFLPYYTYRQSKTLGNLENVGYAKRGYEGLYNVFIMDETHTILAAGASAVTKLKSKDKIKRIFNYKYPYEYIKDFSVLMERKKEIKDFYKKTR
ncbi:MAG: coproporphyrinogen dehydrogenase HemZ [Clostridia bacterium]|nr:coproporphyrinogen dehydrogenase HemZ [Clostridia bacterium]